MPEEKSKEVDVDRIKKDWLFVLETLLGLKQAIYEASVEYKLLPKCLIIGQKLNNQFDYFETVHKVPNEAVSENEFKVRKEKRDEHYKELYKIFDEANSDEIISYIKSALKDNLIKYKMYVSNMERNEKKDIIDMMLIRNDIKYLYDELEIWQGRWRGGGRAGEACDIKDRMCQDIMDYDNALNEYVEKDGIINYMYLMEEARNRLIKTPDDSRRFNFWWWYIPDKNVEKKDIDEEDKI